MLVRGRAFAFAVVAAVTAPLHPGHELVPKEGAHFPRFEASGIAPWNGRLVVIDDTENALFVFDRAGRLQTKLEPAGFPRARAKFEDVAIDPTTGQGFVVGSHEGRNRKTLEAFSQLLRFTLVERDGSPVVDPESVRALPLYKSFERIGLWRPNGMKIEGLAWSPEERALFIGLREPPDPARVYPVSLDALETAARGGPPAPLGEPVVFDAGRMGRTAFQVSGLSYVVRTGSLLVLTSTEDAAHRFLGNRLWLLPRRASPEWVAGAPFPTGDGAPLRAPIELVRDTFDAGYKAEGIAMLGESLYLCYDNDQDDTEIPSFLRILPLPQAIEHGPEIGRKR